MSRVASFEIHAADHVGFAVGSLDDAIRFFVEGLGATLVRTGERSGPFVAEVTGAAGASLKIALVEIGGFLVELVEYVDGPAASAVPPPYAPGMAHLALVVSDIDAALARVAAFGWRAQGTPQAIESGARAGTRVMYVLGPSGETIELMQPPA